MPNISASTPITAPQSEASALEDQRICPVFSASALIKGNTLRMRREDIDARIQAPRKYLNMLYDLCNGEQSLAELEHLAKKRFGDADFVLFVKDLLNAGILVDAIRYSDQIMTRAIASEQLGRSLPPQDFHRLISTLPPGLPSSTPTLPSSGPGKLLSLLAKRRSAPAFSSEPFDPSILSSFLLAAYGTAHCDENGKHFFRRTVPSAGGQYACHVDLVLFRQVGDFLPGAYRVLYSEKGEVGLELITENISQTPRIFYQPWRLHNATGVIVLSSDISRIALKYRNKAFSFAMFEAGAILQNAALIAAEYNFGLRAMGGFDMAMMAKQCARNADTILTCALFGPLMESVHTPLITTEFGWPNILPDAPFHIGCARIVNAERTGEWSWGRDENPTLAYDKALAEAIEREAYRIVTATIEAPMKDLASSIHPNRLVCYSRHQYRRNGFPFARFDPLQIREWVQTENLHSGQTSWTLADCVFHHKSLSSYGKRKPHTYITSSGCASHRTLEKATISALLELIERDAFMRHWLAQKGGITINLRTLPETLKNRINALLERGCEVYIQRLYLGLLPVIMVIIQNHLKHFTAIAAAAGLDIQTTIRSALSEAETSAYARLSGLKSSSLSPSRVLTPSDHADLYAQKSYYRRADPLLVAQHAEDVAETESLLPQSLGDILRIAENAGYQVFRADLTLVDAPRTADGHPLHTVRVLVPDLLPITFGYGLMPLGMEPKPEKGALFPHPFP